LSSNAKLPKLRSQRADWRKTNAAKSSPGLSWLPAWALPPVPKNPSGQDGWVARGGRAEEREHTAALARSGLNCRGTVLSEIASVICRSINIIAWAGNFRDTYTTSL